jgi:hypothetical protein
MSDKFDNRFGRSITLREMTTGMTEEELTIFDLQQELIRRQIRSNKFRWVFALIGYMSGVATPFIIELIKNFL